MMMHSDLVAAVAAEHRRDLERAAARHRLARLARGGRLAPVADRTAAPAAVRQRRPAGAGTPAGSGAAAGAPARAELAGASSTDSGSAPGPGSATLRRPARTPAFPCSDQRAARSSAA